jgi:hypothetical protein
LVGDAIAAARDAILEDLVDFFPNPVRDKIKKALARDDGEAPTSGGSSSSAQAPAAATPAT